LTLECIRRHYDNETSPITGVLSRYAAFFNLLVPFAATLSFSCCMISSQQISRVLKYLLRLMISKGHLSRLALMSTKRTKSPRGHSLKHVTGESLVPVEMLPNNRFQPTVSPSPRSGDFAAEPGR
jgi:hypothetical protein